MTIYERIKIARELIGISQTEASARSGILQKDISQIENGKKTFIPNEYIQFLYNEGVDINSIYDESKNVTLKKLLPLALSTTFSEPDYEYDRLPQGLKAGNSNKNVSPTVSPTQQYGVKTQYLTPKVITVDNLNRENIVYVPVPARAGYLTGYGDAEFISRLPTFNLPTLKSGSYRAFEVQGHSMDPTLKHQEIVIGQWVETLDNIREDRVHIIVTKNEGIVIKRILNRVKKYGYLVAKSDAVDNRKDFPHLNIYPEDIIEIWYAVFHGGSDFKGPAEIYKRQNNLEADVSELMRRLDAAGL